jgi:cytochrome c oxidase cbb3-type subunit I/II
MIRPIRAETERYGEYSKAGEYVYDHPFLWGSKRTGPDLHRVGGKYPDSWHYLHMRQPSATSPGSIMPGYPWLYDNALDTSHVEGKIITLRRLGVPYPIAYERPMLRDLGKPLLSAARLDMQAQAERIAAGLGQAGMVVPPDREIVALIAYLQRLGTDIKPGVAATAEAPGPASGAAANRGAH